MARLVGIMARVKARVMAALIRHGDYHQLDDTPSAWQPFPLKPSGKNHARVAAGNIAEELIKQNCLIHPDCDSSQLLRAWQTAQIICDYLKGKSKEKSPCQINSFAALAERSVGSAANLTLAQIEDVIHNDPRFEPLAKNWKSNSHFCLPLQGAESLMDSGKRVADHIAKQMSDLQKSAEHNTIKLFVGHGAAFRHAAYHLNLLKFKQIAQLSMYHEQPVFIELLEDGSWLHIAGHWKVRDKKSQYTD